MAAARLLERLIISLLDLRGDLLAANLGVLLLTMGSGSFCGVT